MRKFFAFVIAVGILTPCIAASNILLPVKNTASVDITSNNATHKFTLLELTHMKVKDYETVTGKHLTLGDKILFKVAQKKLRNSLDENGNLDNKKVKNLLSLSAKHKHGEMGDSHHWLMLTIITLVLAVGLSIIGIFVPFVWILAGIAGLACAIFFILWLVSLAD